MAAKYGATSADRNCPHMVEIPISGGTTEANHRADEYANWIENDPAPQGTYFMSAVLTDHDRSVPHDDFRMMRVHFSDEKTAILFKLWWL